jgi:hypothetical protein
LYRKANKLNNIYTYIDDVGFFWLMGRAATGMGQTTFVLNSLNSNVLKQAVSMFLLKHWLFCTLFEGVVGIFKHWLCA